MGLFQARYGILATVIGSGADTETPRRQQPQTARLPSAIEGRDRPRCRAQRSPDARWHRPDRPKFAQRTNLLRLLGRPRRSVWTLVLLRRRASDFQEALQVHIGPWQLSDHRSLITQVRGTAASRGLSPESLRLRLTSRCLCRSRQTMNLARNGRRSPGNGPQERHQG